MTKLSVLLLLLCSVVEGQTTCDGYLGAIKGWRVDGTVAKASSYVCLPVRRKFGVCNNGVCFWNDDLPIRTLRAEIPMVEPLRPTYSKVVDFSEKEATLLCCVYNQLGVKLGSHAPVDVPAIQEKVVRQTSGCIPSTQGRSSGWNNDWCLVSDVEYRYTCADKKRVLIYDEQTPPKFWCNRGRTLICRYLDD